MMIKFNNNYVNFVRGHMLMSIYYIAHNTNWSYMSIHKLLNGLINNPSLNMISDVCNIIGWDNLDKTKIFTFDEK